jgi:hypothetical protein
MNKEKLLIVRITEDQEKILEAKTKSAGFIKKSDYVRSVLFMPMSSQEKIDVIYNQVVKNGRQL